ncbi:MAG: SDR family NAD(P)-dependent oxidoreductase [Pseudomonadota bacterium]
MTESKHARREYHETACFIKRDGRVALVAGGGRGIGKFIATGLAEASATLVLASRKPKNLEEAAQENAKETGVAVFPIVCDVARPENIGGMVKRRQWRNSAASTFRSITPGPPGAFPCSNFHV